MQLIFKDDTTQTFPVLKEGDEYRSEMVLEHFEELREIKFIPESEWLPPIAASSVERNLERMKRVSLIVQVSTPALEKQAFYFLKDAIWNVEGMCLLFVILLLVAAQVLCSMGS